MPFVVSFCASLSRGIQLPRLFYSPNAGGRFSTGGDGVTTGPRSAVGASRAVDRTVFWNLVVHFREHCLPITFLLADASTGEATSIIYPDFLRFRCDA